MAINVYLRVQFIVILTLKVVSGMPNIANFISCPCVIHSKLYHLRFETLIKKMIVDTRITRNDIKYINRNGYVRQSIPTSQHIVILMETLMTKSQL